MQIFSFFDLQLIYRMNIKIYLLAFLLGLSSLGLKAQAPSKAGVDITKPVKQQLAAYNNRDINAFSQAFSDTIKVLKDGVLMYEGKEEFRKRYGQMFANTPDLHCEVVNRIVAGNVVIDHEKVRRKKDQPRIDAIAVYRIKNGEIVEVNFISPEKL